MYSEQDLDTTVESLPRPRQQRLPHLTNDHWDGESSPSSKPHPVFMRNSRPTQTQGLAMPGNRFKPLRSMRGTGLQSLVVQGCRRNPMPTRTQ